MALGRPGESLGRRRVQREQALQRALLTWLAAELPSLSALTIHVPNQGTESPIRGAILRGLGVRAGVPDLLCFDRRGPHPGLALELKTGAEEPTELQADWLAGLARLGWFAAWANGLEPAQKAFRLYARLPQWRAP